MERPFDCRVNSNLFDCLLYVFHKLNPQSMWNMKVATVTGVCLFCVQCAVFNMNVNKKGEFGQTLRACTTNETNISTNNRTNCVHILNSYSQHARQHSSMECDIFGNVILYTQSVCFGCSSFSHRFKLNSSWDLGSFPIRILTELNVSKLKLIYTF